jgi:hypothetical protein
MPVAHIRSITSGSSPKRRPTTNEEDERIRVAISARDPFSSALEALVAIAILFRDAIFWAVMSMEGYPRGFAVAHLHAALWQAGMTGACAVVYLLLRSRFITDRTTIERYP